jgi:acyl-coenzyme A thioesterase PaaI-like protein
VAAAGSGPSASASSLFERLGEDSFQATELGRGPWSPDALHGGPVAALVAGVAEAEMRTSGAPPMHPARLTLDLERPVPLDRLRVASRVVRPGRKVQVVEVELFGPDDRRLARATLLGIRQTSVALPDDVHAPADVPPQHRDEARPVPQWVPMDLPMFHQDGVEHRFVSGGVLALGPAQDWIRLQVPVVDDEPISPLQRACAASDFSNGMSMVLPPDGWSFINPDLTVTLHHEPQGEWVCIDAATRVDAAGVGTAESDLFDERGRVGHAVQTLLLEPRA